MTITLHLATSSLTPCLTWPQIVQKAADLQAAISEGATSFLFTEYKYMGVFMVSSPAAVCASNGCRL